MRLNLIAIFIGFLALPSAYSAVEINAFAAKEMSKEGMASLSSFNGSPSEAVEELRRKAIQAGATHFKITSFGTPGDSSYITATAVLYK